MTVYTLCSSDFPDSIRYVGYTSKPLYKRLLEHKSECSQYRTHKDKWISKVLKNGLDIIIHEIDVCESVYELKSKEIYHINRCKELGCKLVNGTNGGDGVVGLKQSQKQKDWNTKTKSKTVYVFDFKSKELLYKFVGIANMIKELKLSTSLVSEVLSGKANFHRGYTISLSIICPKSFTPTHNPWNKGLSTVGKQRFKVTPVMAVKGSKKINFATVNDAKKYFGCSHAYISRKLKEGKLLKGFKLLKNVA